MGRRCPGRSVGRPAVRGPPSPSAPTTPGQVGAAKGSAVAFGSSRRQRKRYGIRFSVSRVSPGDFGCRRVVFMARRGSYAKGIAKREEILDAALDIVARVGYSRTTVRELAQAVGLSQTGLLHYFGTKEQLFVEILRRRDEVDQRVFGVSGDGARTEPPICRAPSPRSYVTTPRSPASSSSTRVSPPRPRSRIIPPTPSSVTVTTRPVPKSPPSSANSRPPARYGPRWTRSDWRSCCSR